MKEVTVKVPEMKLEFFMDLINQLGFELADEMDPGDIEIEIPEEHKAIVRERIRKSEENPDRLLNWDDVKDNFRFEK